MITRIIKYISTLIVIIALLFGLRLLENTISEQVEVKPLNVMEKDLYNGYGLKDNAQLSSKVIFEDKEYVCYSDRLLKKFSYSEDNINYLSIIMNGLLKTCKDDQRVMVMPIPPRIITEDGWVEQKESYSKYIKSMESNLPSGVQLIDVSAKLQEHNEEYIFFRTESSWTARGAFYGMEVLGEKLGIKTRKLEDYEEYMYKSFTGNLCHIASDKYASNVGKISSIEDIPSDRTYYYLLPDAKNQTETIDKVNGLDYHVKRKTITESEAGINTFVGGIWDRAIVEGDGLDTAVGENAVVMICDYYGKLLAPFLANYYSQVYLINIYECSDFSTQINEIMKEYNVCDIILVQESQILGDKSYNRALNSFAGVR